MEPLLGPVSLLSTGEFGSEQWINAVRWVIVGGESGNKARPMNPEWARNLCNECQLSGVPFHFKQWGEWGPHPVGDWDKKDIQWLDDMHVWRVGKKAAGRVLDGRTWDELPLSLNDLANGGMLS
jgi:protein gp37